MKEQDLLKALGDIREDYILEAAPVKNSRDAEGQTPERKIIPWRRYGRTAGIIAAGLVLVAGFGIYHRLGRNLNQQESTGMVAEYSVEDTAPKASYSGTGQGAGMQNQEAKDMAESDDIIEDADILQNDDEMTVQNAARTDEASSDESMMDSMDEGIVEEIGDQAPSAADEKTDSTSYDAEFAEEEVVSNEEDIVFDNANLPNPWITCATLAEAEKESGFSLQISGYAADPAYAVRQIYAVADTLIEVRYVDDNGDEGYRIRKGIGTESVDGDYNLYDTEDTLQIGGKEVTLKGNGSEIAVARWTDQDYSYAVITENIRFTETEIRKLIRGIK